ncbi:MAG: MBL fold metallo-hydrolase [Candidatus Ozemobacteraceae bacterium]
MMNPTKLFAVDGLKCERFILGPIDVNCYLIYDVEAQEGLVVDPAEGSTDLLNRISELSLKPVRIFLTHGHADHIEGVDEVRAATKATVLISKEDAPMLADGRLNLSAFMGAPFTVKPADAFLAHGDEIRVGRHVGKVIAVPGHTPGGLALAFPGLIIVGDTLFAGSVGRSDFPGGDGRQLLSMIEARLFSLDDGIVLPGHGPDTTISEEKVSNPFLQDS